MHIWDLFRLIPAKMANIIIYISTYSETSFPILMCAYFCYGICENEISLSGCDLVTLSFKFIQLNDSSCITGCNAFAKYIRMQHSESSSSNPECPFVPVIGSLSIGEQVYISRGANCLLYSCQVWTIYFKIWCSWIEEICYHTGNSTRSSSPSF